MFKMGCSMAKRILTNDGRNNNSSSSSSPGQTQDGSSSKKSSKDKQHQLAGQEGGSGAGGGGSKPRASGDELNDFSKLEEDPRIPLNVRQIFKITKSWKAIARTMSKTGTAMFLNLFEQNQDLFALFARFQHLKGKELHESMELKEHAATVMSTLDHSINSLSDYDNFVTYLHSIGKLHRKVPGFKRDHFWKIEQPFLKAVKQTLDERCNETIEEIYKIAIKLIIETIAAGYGEDQPDNSGPGTGTGKAPSGGNGNGGASGGAGNENSGPGGGDNGQLYQQQNGGGGGDSTSNSRDGTGRGSNMSPLGSDNSGGGRRNCGLWGRPMDDGGGSGVCAIAQREAPKSDVDDDDDDDGDDDKGMHHQDKRAPIEAAKTDKLGARFENEAMEGTGAFGEQKSASDGGDERANKRMKQRATNEGQQTLFALKNLLALMVAGGRPQQPTRRPLTSAKLVSLLPEARNVDHLQAPPAPATKTTRSITTTINTIGMGARQTDGCVSLVGPSQVGFGPLGGSGAVEGARLGAGSLINYDGHQFGRTTNVQHQQERDAPAPARNEENGMMSHGRDAELNFRNDGGEKCCSASGTGKLQQLPLRNPEEAYRTRAIGYNRKRPAPCCPRLPGKPNDKTNPATISDQQEQHRDRVYISGSSSSNSNNNNNNNDDDNSNNDSGSGATNSIGSIYGGPVSTNTSGGPNLMGPGWSSSDKPPVVAGQLRGAADGMDPIAHNRPFPLDAAMAQLEFVLDECGGHDAEIGHSHPRQQPNGQLISNAAPDTTTTITNIAGHKADSLTSKDDDDDDRGETQFYAHTTSNKSDNMANHDSSCPDRDEGDCMRSAKCGHGTRRITSVKRWQLKQSSFISSLVNRKPSRPTDRGACNLESGQSLGRRQVGGSNRADGIITRDRKANNKFMLSSDPGDLCELIKMLMLTVASRKACLDDATRIKIDC